MIGILVGLLVLMALAFRGWTILVLAPLAAMVAAAFSGEPLLVHWTQTFMPAAASFVGQFFALFLLGAVLGKLMDDSGSVIAEFMSAKLGPSKAFLAVVLAGAMVTYGGVSLFVAFFVIAPMGLALFRAGGVPRRLLPAAVGLGTLTFTMSAVLGTPAIQNAIPMPCFGKTPLAAPIGLIATAVMFACGMWRLGLRRSDAIAAGEGFGGRGRRGPQRRRGGARAGLDRALVRPGRDGAGRRRCAHAAHPRSGGAAGHGGAGEPADVAGGAARAGLRLSRRSALGGCR